jgi:plasmid stabilization system protein ParE
LHYRVPAAWELPYDLFVQAKLNRRIIMPRGDKSKYTDKQERKADHIAEGYEKRGVPEQEAERRAWATVNKDDGGGKNPGGSGRGKSTGHPAAHKGGEKGGAASASRFGGQPLCVCEEGCGHTQAERSGARLRVGPITTLRVLVCEARVDEFECPPFQRRQKTTRI